MAEKKLEIEINDELITKEVAAFAEIAATCITLYAKKNADYGNSFDKGMCIIGMAYGVGRLYDKMNRLITLSNPNQKQQVKDESIDDTLMDLACYSIMMLSYRKKEIENKQKQINFE